MRSPLSTCCYWCWLATHRLYSQAVLTLLRRLKRLLQTSCQSIHSCNYWYEYRRSAVPVVVNSRQRQYLYSVLYQYLTSTRTVSLLTSRSLYGSSSTRVAHFSFQKYLHLLAFAPLRSKTWLRYAQRGNRALFLSRFLVQLVGDLKPHLHRVAFPHRHPLQDHFLLDPV